MNNLEMITSIIGCVFLINAIFLVIIIAFNDFKKAFKIFNPIELYKLNKLNKIGVCVVTVISNTVFILWAIGYWIYILFTIGVEDNNDSKDKEIKIVEETEQALNEFVELCIKCCTEKDFYKLKELLKKFKDVYEVFSVDVSDYDNKLIVYDSQFVQTYNIMNKICSLQTYNEHLKNDIEALQSNYPCSKDILSFMYQRSKNSIYVDEDTLCYIFDLYKNDIPIILKEMISMNIVYVMEGGKGNHYILTSQAIGYLSGIYY